MKRCPHCGKKIEDVVEYKDMDESVVACDEELELDEESQAMDSVLAELIDVMDSSATKKLKGIPQKSMTISIKKDK